MTAFQDGLTQYNIIVGAANKALASIAPSATSGVPVISQGSSSNPTFGVVVPAGGGTGLSSLTAYAIIAAGTTSTGTLQQLAIGNSGQILRSGGAGALSGWSTATYPATAGTAGKMLVSDGTNIVSSTPTFPNASATSGKIIKSDGTNWVASTETYPVPSTSGNVMTSDGTNWTSAAASGGTWGGYTVTTVTGTLSNAQIKALNASPVQIVAAQGAGTIIIPVQYCLKMNYGGTNVFTAAASQTINFAYGGALAGTIVLSNAGIVASTVRIAYGNAATQSATYTNQANAALQWWNPIATEISGNAANNNTMPWSVTYIVVTI